MEAIPDRKNSLQNSVVRAKANVLDANSTAALNEALNNNIIIEDRRFTTNSRFEETMLSTVANLQTQQTQMLLTLNELLRYHRKTAMENLIEPDNLPVFPLKTLEEFLHFEELIHNDDIIKQYMVRRLAALGGSGVESFTRRIMKFLISNDLATNFNWKGRFTKRAFEHTRAMGVIYDAAKQTIPANEHSDLLVANTVKEWLKHAVTRIKQGVRRRVTEQDHA